MREDLTLSKSDEQNNSLREERDKASREYEVALRQCRFSPTKNNRDMLIKAKTKLDNIMNKAKRTQLWENQI